MELNSRDYLVNQLVDKMKKDPKDSKIMWHYPTVINKDCVFIDAILVGRGRIWSKDPSRNCKYYLCPFTNGENKNLVILEFKDTKIDYGMVMSIKNGHFNSIGFNNPYVLVLSDEIPDTRIFGGNMEYL